MPALTDAPDAQYAKTTDGNYVAYQIAGSVNWTCCLCQKPGGTSNLLWEV